jgi:hypothetical protein
MNDIRSFGITELHEGSKSSDDEQNFNNRIKPYRVATLQNAALRVDVAPELSGRVIRMIDRRTGHDLLRRPDPGERSYPDTGGLSLTVNSDYLGRTYETTWELEPQTEPTELRLTGTYTNGLKASCVIQLRKDETVLHTETTLKNQGDTAQDAVLQSRYVAGPRNMDESVLSFRRQDGKTTQQRLIEAGLEPRGAETYDGPEQPDGEWMLSEAGPGLALVNRFPKDQVSRCFARWTGKTDNSAIMGIWSIKRSLAPGETLKLEADYEIRRTIS